MSVSENIDYIIAVSGLTLSIISLIRLFFIRYLGKSVRLFFIMLFATVNVYTLCILIREIIRDRTGYGWAVVSRIVFFGQAFLSSSLTIMIIGFLLYQSGETAFFKSPVFRLAVLLWLVYVLLLISTQFNGKIYMVDDRNRYSRGDYFTVLMIPPILIMLLNIYTILKKWYKLSVKQRVAFVCYAVVPLICMLMQSVFFGIHLIALGTVIAAVIMYSYIVSEQMDIFIRQQEENARLKIDILLTQIKPHFLYNSLTSIQYLCKNDSEMAYNAIGDFTTYLRHNMDSLTIDKPIPFMEELAHVNAYLALQKMRFGDELNVEYDLQYTDFYIPTLTFQPLVENAVSYGVRKSVSGIGTVLICSRLCEDHIELEVKDDGSGFLTNAHVNDGERTHTGISNVKERLKRISGGDIVIESIPGKGTSATIMLPLSAKEEDGSC